MEAVVQHLIPDSGVGLKFTAITDKDCPRLITLMNRVSGEGTHRAGHDLKPQK